MSQDDRTVDIAQFEGYLGLRFNERGLLKQALTHRSYINEQIEDDIEDNERLEYLGDAILDFLTADMLYRRFPDMAEGEMTRLRAALVRTESLAQLAQDLHVGEALFIGKGEASTGGRLRDHNLCGAFEAIIGAMYLDQGLQAVKDFVIPRLTALQQDVMDDAIRKDARSQFQEWAQALLNITPHYHVVDTEGPEHEKIYHVDAMLAHHPVARGKGRTKRAAAQDAARVALRLRDRGQLDLSGLTPSVNEDPAQSQRSDDPTPDAPAPLDPDR